MNGRGWGCVAVALLALGNNSCEQVGFLSLCDPTDTGRVVGFYSTGDCLGTDASLFRGHEWLTLFANDEGIFSDDQINTIVEGNRHTDYPQELLVQLDNGALAYLDALLAYHNNPAGQAEHFILRSDNSHYQARDEALGLLVGLTKDAVRHWNDNQIKALTRIGRATHELQDSYSQAHAVRAPQPDLRNDPPFTNVPWCMCKLKTFVPRAEGCLTDDIEFHDQFDDQRRPGHLTALDSIYDDRKDCHDPRDEEIVRRCLIPEATQAIVATRDYLVLVRELVTTAVPEDEIEARLQPYFDMHFPFCDLPALVRPGDSSLVPPRPDVMCDRPDESVPACQ